MSGLSDKYNYKAIAEHLWQMSHMPAVIVGVATQDDTQFSGKFDTTPPDVVAQRYRIRLLGIDPPDKPENRLPLAYPLQLTSGLGAQDSGIIRYPPNTYVYVSKESYDFSIKTCNCPPFKGPVKDNVKTLKDYSQMYPKRLSTTAMFIDNGPLPNNEYNYDSFINGCDCPKYGSV